MNLTKIVGEYIASERSSQLSDEIVESIKVCLLDWLAVSLAGSREYSQDIILKSVDAKNGSGEATVIGTSLKVSPMMAALVNGTAAHVLDYDDVHDEEPGHPGAVVNPAAFSLAETLGASGRQLVDAVATGIHIMFTINSGMMPEHYNKGWHNTGTLGHMGSAAAVAKLLNLDVNQCINALGLAGIQMAGLRSSFGNMGKPFHAGKAAMNGVLSGLLASNGFVAPEDIIGGTHGLLEVMTPKAHPEKVLATLTGEHQSKFLRYKRFPSCLGTHPSIENAIAIHKANNINIDDVEKIILVVYPRILDIAAIEKPVTGLEGKFSVQFCAAAGLIKGKLDLSDFNEETVTAPEIVSLRSKVALVPEESYQETRSAKMKVVMKDGTEYCHLTNLKELLADQEKQKKDVIEKYRSLAPAVLKEEAVEPLLEQIMKLDSLSNVKEISRYLSMVKA